MNMDMKKEDINNVYKNLDSNEDGILTIDEMLKFTSENAQTKKFLDKLNENLLPTSEVISQKLSKLRNKLSGDKEALDDIDW